MTARVWTAEEVVALGVRTDLVTAASVLGIGRTVAHELARRGTFPVPVLRVGARYVVPVTPLLALLGITPQDAGEPPSLSPAAAHLDPTGGPRHGARSTLHPVANTS